MNFYLVVIGTFVSLASAQAQQEIDSHSKPNALPIIQPDNDNLFRMDNLFDMILRPFLVIYQYLK